jgi:hypothetical protein
LRRLGSDGFFHRGLRRVHQRDRDATPQELLEMTVAERERPLMLCRWQIGIYIEEFERARAAGDAAARDAADRRLFQWARYRFS